MTKKKEGYTIKKIIQIIRCYHINVRNLKELQQEEMKSAGVSQYGIEASMPKSGGISSVVENEVIRQIENTKFWAEMITDIKYIQDRWHRVTEEKEAQVLSLCLDGHKTSDIAEIMKMDRSGVYRTLGRVARQIKGYPQASATDSTDYDVSNSL